MSISIFDYCVHLQDDLKLNREYLKFQGSQNEGQKVFDRDSLEVSQLSKNREILQNYMFGNGRMYEMINRLGNLQERVK